MSTEAVSFVRALYPTGRLSVLDGLCKLLFRYGDYGELKLLKGYGSIIY